MHCCSESRKKKSLKCCLKTTLSLTIPAVPLDAPLPLHCWVRSSLTSAYVGSLVSLTSLCSTKALLYFKNSYVAKTCRAMRLYVPCSTQPAPGDNPSPVLLQKWSAPMAKSPSSAASSCWPWVPTTARHLHMFPPRWEPKVSVNSCNAAPSLEAC